MEKKIPDATSLEIIRDKWMMIIACPRQMDDHCNFRNSLCAKKSLAQMLNVWPIYLHLVDFYGKLVG